MEILTLGEVVVEFFSENININFSTTSKYLGPFPSGAAAIFIDVLGKLGRNVGIIGTIGNDGFGKCIKSKLKFDGVDITGLRTINKLPTGVAFTNYFDNNVIKYLFHMKNAACAKLELGDIKDRYFKNIKYLHISGNTLLFSENTKEACLLAIEKTHFYGGKISFDINIRSEMIAKSNRKDVISLLDFVINKSYILFPSIGDFSILYGKCNEEILIRELLKKGTKIIAVKMGRRGSKIYKNDDEILIKPFKVKEINPQGAGDCYDAGFLYGIIKNWDLYKIGTFANAVGALSTTEFGPMNNIGTIDQVDSFINGQRPNIFS